ncbi:MAG: hypothetical protein HFE86_03050 [Clostridiales bacterium]|nr:hypothetical protein [Clostridiales bacterium]
MKRFLIGLWIGALLLSFAAVPLNAAALEGGALAADPAGEGFTGTKNTAAWKPEAGVDYEKYDFLGRGEELLKEVQAAYPDYTVAYRLDGQAANADTLNRMVNVMAVYKDADPAAKILTVEADSITIRLQCEYTDLRGSAGSFMSVSFTTNLPSIFLASISADPNDRNGEIRQDNIRPTGEKGTYTAKVKLTIPYVQAGRYYLNFFNDSWNAGYPHLLSVPLDITEGAHSDSPYHLLYAGDWDMITAEGYQESLTQLFYNSYPRLYARFGLGSEPKTITFTADKAYDGVAYNLGQNIVVSVDYANRNPRDIGFFSHEITHAVQQYSKMSYDGDHPDEGLWWIENMANYGGFRYFHWSDADYVQIYRADDPSLQDWGYQAYGNNKWFFAYMDAKYPTVKNADGTLKYGLIDSINRLIKTYAGSDQLSANPKNPDTPFSKIVKDITGYDCIESLRLHYVEELKSGSWSFTGFGDYADNFITEDLPGVPNPDYPAVTAKQPGGKTAQKLGEVVTGEGNLCLDGSIHRFSGQTNSGEGAALLIDGNENTKWCSTTGAVNDQTYCLDGTRQWVIIDLGGWKSFDTYTIFNTHSKEGFGNMTEWELLTSDDGKSWTSVDYQPACNEAKASFDIGKQSGRYLLLKAYNPDDGGPGTIRLYEFQLFNRSNQPDPVEPAVSEQAERIERKIAAIGKADYSVACGERIQTARAAYDAAAAEVQGMVSNLAVLEQAEAAYAAFFEGVRKVENGNEITPIAGPGDGDEKFDNMFDGKLDTKFGAWDPGDPILFSADKPIAVKYYAFTTGADSGQWPGRNPKNWTLYGCNDYTPERDGDWKVIDAVEGNGDLPDANCVEVRFAVDAPAAYRFYKLVFRNHPTWLQLSEVGLYALDAAVELADYAAVDAALAKIPKDLSVYTDASAAALQSAVNAVVRELPITEQTTVDGYAEAIQRAVAKLAYKDADYQKVNDAIKRAEALDQSLYKDFSAVTKAIAAVVRGKNITEQAAVDAMAKAIEEAVGKLEFKPADYAAVDAAIAKVPADLSGYTDASAAALQSAVNAVVRELPITEQADVDAMAKAIEEAVAGLQKKSDSPGETVPGDMNKDGKITIQDVMEACKALARQSAGKAPTADEMKRGDLDGDDKLTIADVMEICKLLARQA